MGWGNVIMIYSVIIMIIETYGEKREWYLIAYDYLFIMIKLLI